MANQGTNKQKDENVRHMAKLRHIMIVCNILYIILRMLFARTRFTWKDWFGLVVTTLGYTIPYKFLYQMAKANVTNNGFNMRTDGICRYMDLVLYLTCFVQLASIVSGKFWYPYLLFPVFGAWQLVKKRSR